MPGVLDSLFAKKPLKKAAEEKDANKSAPPVQDNTYIKGKIAEMAKKKTAPPAAKKLSPAGAALEDPPEMLPAPPPQPPEE